MRTIAITGGKGGVGKTNVSANLALALSSMGRRVLVFDADIGLANLDVVMGCRARKTFQDALSSGTPLREVITEAPGGVKIIAGGSGIESVVSIADGRGEQVLQELADLEGELDELIFDTAAGIDLNVMSLLMASDEVLVIATPDPASLTDSYATTKALLMQRPHAEVKVVVNMVDDESQGRLVHARLNSISQQFLHRSLGYAGCIRMDLKALGHIRRREPFFLHNPQLPASQDIARIAAGLLGRTLEPAKEGLAQRLRGLFGGNGRAA